MRYTPSGVPVAKFRLAVNKQWTTQDGERREKTTWFSITTWRKQAEIVNQYLTTGSKVLIVGEIEEASVYTNKAGEPAASLEVTAQEVRFLDSRQDKQGGQGDGPRIERRSLEDGAVIPTGIAQGRAPISEAEIPF